MTIDLRAVPWAGMWCPFGADCAKIKVMVKRILNKHGYWLPRCRRSVGLRPAACAPHSLSQSPCSFGSPDLQEEAVKTVLAQAELLCAYWV